MSKKPENFTSTNIESPEIQQKFFLPSEIVKAFDEGRIEELVADARKAALAEAQNRNSTHLKKSVVEMAKDRIAREQAARGR